MVVASATVPYIKHAFCQIGLSPRQARRVFRYSCGDIDGRIDQEQFFSLANWRPSQSDQEQTPALGHESLRT